MPQSDAWESGSFPAIAAAISPAFGKVILVASTASGVSQCIASIACYSRQLQVRADIVASMYPYTRKHASLPHVVLGGGGVWHPPSAQHPRP